MSDSTHREGDNLPTFPGCGKTAARLRPTWSPRSRGIQPEPDRPPGSRPGREVTGPRGLPDYRRHRTSKNLRQSGFTRVHGYLVYAGATPSRRRVPGERAQRDGYTPRQHQTTDVARL